MTNKQMTPKRLHELEQAATAGPWEVVDTSTQGYPLVTGGDTSRAGISNGGFSIQMDERNAALIVETRNILPALIKLWEAVTENTNDDAAYDDVTYFHDPYCACRDCRIAEVLRNNPQLIGGDIWKVLCSNRNNTNR